jgi:hypothetical protein
MVKVGKFQKRGLGIQVRSGAGAGSPPYGVWTPAKRFWFGQLCTKRFDAATADPINLGAATWGFTRIDWAQIWVYAPGTARKAVGAGFGAGVATTMQWYNQATTRIFIGATIRATTGMPIYGMIFGQ